MNAVLSRIVAGVAVSTILVGGFGSSAMASTVAAPTVQPITVQQVGPVDHDPVTDPYTGHLADRLLGSDLVAPEPAGLDRSNPQLIELQRALVNDIKRFGSVYTVNGVQWAKMSDTRIVIRNTSGVWVRIYLPTTGAEYLMAPYSGNIVFGKPAELNMAIPPVQGAIGSAYLNQGGPDKFGYATSAEIPVAGGVKQTFANGYTFYWSSATGVKYTKGAINTRYNNAGGPVGLGFPTINEQALASGGVYQQFQKGRIYWSPSTGAHVVDQGDIGRKYVALGGSTSALGYPTSSKIKLSNSEYIQYFANGFIAWKNGYITVSTATPVVTR